MVCAVLRYRRFTNAKKRERHRREPPAEGSACAPPVPLPPTELETPACIAARHGRRDRSQRTGCCREGTKLPKIVYYSSAPQTPTPPDPHRPSPNRRPRPSAPHSQGEPRLCPNTSDANSLEYSLAFSHNSYSYPHILLALYSGMSRVGTGHPERTKSS